MRIQHGRARLVVAAMLLVVVGCGEDNVFAPDADRVGPDGQPLAAIGAVEEVCAVVDFESLSHGDPLTVMDVPELELSFHVTPWPVNSSLPSARIYSTDTMSPPGDPFLAWAGTGATCLECLGLGNVLVFEDGAGFDSGGASEDGGTFFLDAFTQPDVRIRDVKAVAASTDASHQVWIDAEWMASTSAALGAVQTLTPTSEPPITNFVELVVRSGARGGFDDLQLCRMMETSEDPGESEQGGEGCPVGFWKQAGNSAAWNETGILPDRTIVDGEGLTGRIAQQGEVIFIEKDSSHDPRIERMVINEEGLHSFIGVPITAEGETVAVMNILTRPPHTLGEDDVSLVQAVASYVGPAIRNARLFSELERAEEELRGSEKRLREVVDSTPFPVTIVDLQDDRILYWSRSAIELLGHTAPTSEEWYRIAYPDPEYRRQVIARWKPLLEEARASGTPVNAGEYRVTCGDGSVRVCELYANFIPGKLIITFNDITERKAAEADRILLFTAIEQSHESIVITDPKGDILYVNSAFERLTGYSREVALGRNPRILKSGRHDTAFYRNMWETVLSGNVWTGKIVNRRKDGSLFTELTTISPVQDDSGELQAFVAVKRDVTEEEEMRARLAQAQKMESIGRLAGGVAHDFNNLLAVMMSQLDLALLSDDLPTSVSDRFEQIQTSISSAADLTRQLLMFARKQRVIAKKVDLNVVVEVTLKMLRRLIGEDIELSWCPQADLWPVWIDPSQIDQLLANLCVNARDAISGGGKVTVATANLLLADEI
ncbi:MAG: PAS domain S-box protein, partial [Gemmatimonadota bacterium]